MQKLKDPATQNLMYPILCRLAKHVVLIPHSNAYCETLISMVKKNLPSTSGVSWVEVKRAMQLPVYTVMYTVLGTLSVDFLPLKSMCLKRQNATNGIHQMTFLKEPNRQHMKLSIIKHELI